MTDLRGEREEKRSSDFFSPEEGEGGHKRPTCVGKKEERLLRFSCSLQGEGSQKMMTYFDKLRKKCSQIFPPGEG